MIRDQKLAGYFKEPKQTRLATANGSRVSICYKNFGTLQGPAPLDGGRDRPPTNTPLPYSLSCQMWSFEVKRYERNYEGLPGNGMVY